MTSNTSRLASRQSTSGHPRKPLKKISHIFKNTSQNSTSQKSLSRLIWQIVFVQKAEISNKNKNE